LRGLSGVLNVGTMTAIMGPTGSGKTSLLNILANRMPVVKGASLGGELLVNGRHVSRAAWGRRFARLSAYVMQEDVMNAYLTVRETLWLAASFQLPPTITEDEKARLVSAVIR
jgi:ABC-type multidrug transport system ATPase subunit